MEPEPALLSAQVENSLTHLPTRPAKPYQPNQEAVVAKEQVEAESPFLDGTWIQWAWDSTALEALKRCPRYYYYEYIEGWKTKEESIHLRFGGEFHRAMQDYDLSRAAGIAHNDAVHDTIRALIGRLEDYPEPDTEAKPSVRYKTREALIRSVIWYLEKYAEDNLKTFIKADGTPAVELSFRFELDYGPGLGTKHEDGTYEYTSQPYLLCGHLDRVVEFGGDLFIMDYKTTTSTPGSHYFNQFEPHNQMSLYTLAGQVLLQAPVKGIIINAIQIKTDSTEFTRGFTYRTSDQLDEWLKDLQFTLQRAEDYAAEEYWPQNDTSCDKYGGCKFRSVCSRSPSVRDTFLETDFVRGEVWNPLVSRG